MMKRIAACLLAMLLVLTGSATAEDVQPMFTDRDCDPSWDEKEAVRIVLDGDGAEISDRSVIVSGKLIQLTEQGTYVVSGTLNDGTLVVNAPEDAKVQIVLADAHITSATSAALYVLEADKVFVTLAEGTENTLANGGTFEAIDKSNIDAAVFSKQDLIFNGAGKLTVTSPAGHGIVSKDDLKFTGGTCMIEAASHAIQANDSVRIRGAAITAQAGKDGIQVENADEPDKGYVYIESGALNIQAEGDGISAGAYMTITGGAVDILAGGGSENGTKASSEDWGRFGGFGGGFGGKGDRGSRGNRPGWEEPNAEEDTASTSMKGLKAVGNMTLTGGTFTINSADDAIHSNASVNVSGGTFALASGDDAIHADDTLTIIGGTINISESYEGLEALHIAVEGGDIRVVASDDGVNAAGGTDESGITGGRDGRFGGGPGGFGGRGGRGGWGGNSDGTIVISGGTLHISASGDGIDVNGSLLITGGYTVVTGPTQGDTSVLDYDLTGEMTGGTFIGTGSAMMAQSLSSQTQGVVAVSVGRQAEGTEITVTDATGEALLTHTPELSYQILIFSSPDVISGETYTLHVGTATGEIVAD